MSREILFWVLMLIWLVFAGGSGYLPDAHPLRRFGGSLLIFILFAILGWQVFGAPVK